MNGERHSTDGLVNFVKTTFRGKRSWDAMPVNKDADITTKGRLFTVRQAANYLGTTAASLYTKIWRREISFIKLGRSVRFDVKDLDVLIELSRVESREFSMIRDGLKARK